MTDAPDGDHYRAAVPTERAKAALTVFGPDEPRLTPQQAATLDRFHTRRLAATVEFAKLAGITAATSVLDAGSAFGGPARFLAATCGCEVADADFSEPFIDAARYLTDRQADVVWTADALELPFDGDHFDAVLGQQQADGGLVHAR